MICVLQFDAASVAVVDRLLAEGRLPALAGLIARGRKLDLATPANHFAAGAFHTLYSGVDIDDHGLFYPFQWDASSQRARYMTAFPAPPAIWERLARAGLRTLAVDPYESRPPRDWRGSYVCGWQFADRVVLPRWSLPKGLGRKLAGRHGLGPQATEIFGRPEARQLLALREKLVAAPGRVADVAVDLLGRERYDLVWLTFSAAHLAGHQFWDLSQLAVEPDGGDRDLLEGALANVYEAVDGAFARVLAALPGDTDVIVASAVGMDVNSSRADLLPGMLAAVLAGGPLPSGGGAAGAIWRLRGAVPPRARGAIAGALPDRTALELTARLELRGVDWSTTKAFAHPADNQGYVRLNLRGRERDGIVEAAEADELHGRDRRGPADVPRSRRRAGGRGHRPRRRPLPRRARPAAPGPRRELERAPGDDARRCRVAGLRRGPAQRRGQRALGQPHARRRLGGRDAGEVGLALGVESAAPRRRRVHDRGGLRRQRRRPGGRVAARVARRLTARRAPAPARCLAPATAALRPPTCARPPAPATVALRPPTCARHRRPAPARRRPASADRAPVRGRSPPRARTRPGQPRRPVA